MAVAKAAARGSTPSSIHQPQPIVSRALHGAPLVDITGVPEALASGTPVISTKGAPWSALDTMGCGWWIDDGVEPLAAALATAMAMPRQTLKAMGAKGRTWMRKDFSWARVA